MKSRVSRNLKTV